MSYQQDRWDVENKTEDYARRWRLGEVVLAMVEVGFLWISLLEFNGSYQNGPSYAYNFQTLKDQIPWKR